MEEKLSNEFIKYYFTDNEKKDIAIEMAQKVADLQRTEDDKKAVMSDYKSQLDHIQAGINGAATKLNNGYEMRTVKCKNVPVWKKKVWECRHVDTNELFKTKPMSADDLQMKL